MDSKSSHRHRIESLLHRGKSSSLFSISTSQTKLCELCQNISFSTMRRGESSVHGRPSQITASAEAGCPFCSLLYQYFDLGPESLPVRLNGIRRKLSLKEKAALVDEGDIEALRVINGYDREVEDSFAHKLALYTTYDDVAASSVNRRPPIKDLGSDESFRLIKSWLDSCVFHHPGCNSPIISQLPTRVLDVGTRGGEEDPILFTPPKGYKDSYIALSYCWGNTGTKYILKKSQLEVPKLTFPFATLPQTLKHAVQITRRLGFRVLWIDALCIIQEGDGGKDFRSESATMHTVYGNATITIAAAAGDSVHEGIFQKRTENSGHHEPPECKIRYDLSDNTIGTCFVEYEDIEKGSNRIEEPLNKRAWTFQERILSPRVVLFYKDEIGWDCASRLINSNGPLNPILNRNQDSPGRFSDFIATRVLSNEMVEYESEYMAYWRTSVEFYSRRSLTNPGDKLKAISGIAQQIYSRTNTKYCAGVWLSDLYPLLYWFSNDPNRKVQEKCITPSWSWASIDGKIQFCLDQKSYYPSAQNPDWETSPEIDMKLISSIDPFGDIREARLTLKGQLNVWSRSLGVGALQHGAPGYLQHNTQILGFFFDNPLAEKDFFDHARDSEYFFFRPLPSQIYSETLYPALILQKTSGCYRRAGIFSARIATYYPSVMREWMRKLGSQTPTTITIL